MKIKAVVFDWDGTLFNSMSYKRSNFVALFEKFSIATDDLIHFHVTYSGIPRKELFNRCLEMYTGQKFSEIEYQAISEKYTMMNLESSKTTRPFEDVEPGLKLLSEKGLKLFVSSSSAHDELTNV